MSVEADRRRVRRATVVAVVALTAFAFAALAAPASAADPDAAAEWLVTPASELFAGAPGAAESPPLCTLPAPAASRSDAEARPPAEPGPPEYYGFSLVTTGRIPGTARAEGAGRVVFPSTSPFGVAVAEDGSYRYELVLSAQGLPRPRQGRYVAWVTTPNLDRVERVGALPRDGELRGRVDWNKFLVVVTLEPAEPVAAGGSDEGAGPSVGGPAGGSPSAGRSAPQEMWSGPIILRGMSRSGMMHTMAGHGPFEEENCAAYGY